MVLTEVEKFMVATIGGFEVMSGRCFGCDEDYVARALFVCHVLVTCSSGLIKRG
jgi:hypothetical protein